MRSWFRTLVGRDSEATRPERAIDILVVEGPDAGQQFTVDGDEIPVGRRSNGEARARGVFLHDPTVSTRQATIRRQAGGFVLHHDRGATNPTLIDGSAALAGDLRPGARIQMGRTVMEVRANQALGLSNLTQFLSDENADATTQPDRHHGSKSEATTEMVAISAPAGATLPSGIQPVPRTHVGYLVVLHGFDAATAPGRKLSIWSGSTRLGRSHDVEIQLADPGISREHAELIHDNGELRIVHHSAVNPTFLNGQAVQLEEIVRHGDQIQLAGRVSFRVEIEPTTGPRIPPPAPARAEPTSLSQEMERKLALDQQIADRYRVTGSFLDVDVVNSYGMKSAQSRPEHIIVSFERFREYIAGIVSEHRGVVLNSNGDELMCYFESSVDAVATGSQILARLDDFNQRENMLDSPFCFRIGVHTGESLVDLDRGVAYSVILDAAGHLQKHAETNSMVISKATLESLGGDAPFEFAGRLDRDGLDYFRLLGPVD